MMNYNRTPKDSLASHLPPELLSDIFNRLPLSDVKVCRSVCRSWGWSASRQLGERSSLDFRGHDDFIGASCVTPHVNEQNETESRIQEKSSIGAISPLSLAAFKSLRLRKVSVAFSSDSIASRWMWGPVVAGLTSLTLDQCPITERDFVRILSHCIEQLPNSSSQPTHNDASLVEHMEPEKYFPTQSSKLRSLALIDTRELFMSGALMIQPKDKLIISLALENVAKLDLSGNSYMTDILFGRLTSCTPKLQTVILNRINIQYHPGIYKKYYPELVAHVSQSEGSEGVAKADYEAVAIFNSPSIFSYGCLLQYLRNIAPQIRKLGLQDTNLPDSLLQKIASVPKLQLQSLDISRNLGIKQQGMRSLAHHQGCHLSELDISFCRRITMDYHPDLLKIFEGLSGLKRLSLCGLSCARGLDECLICLPNLEHLEIVDCDIPARHLADGIVKPLEEAKSSAAVVPNGITNDPTSIEEKVRNPLDRDVDKHSWGVPKGTILFEEHRNRMRSASERCCAQRLSVLILSRYSRAVEQLLRIFQWTSNLTHLDFEGCFVNDAVVQQIFQTLHGRGMTHLNLNMCEGVTAFGYTGNLPDSNKPPSNDKVKTEDSLDGKDKIMDTGHVGYNISSLKTLTTLKIGATGVTDSAILAAFQFHDLRTIDLSGCKGITDAGFIALAQQNPHIETLIAKSCCGLNDKGLISIACYLQRLSHLNIDSCRGITSAGLTSGSNVLPAVTTLDFTNYEGLSGCMFLQYLNASRCPKISLVAIDTLVERIGSSLKIKMHGVGLAGMIDGALRMEEYGSSVTSTLGISRPTPPTPPPPPPSTHQHL